MIIPNHIGLIPDGNRRWARKNNLPIWKGHEKGAEKIEEFLNWCKELRIKNVTIYTLSEDNILKREPKEIKMLFKIIFRFLKKMEKKIDEEEVKLNVIGDLSLLPKYLAKLIFRIVKKSSKYSKYIINLLIGYSSIYEIYYLIKKMKNITIKKLEEEIGKNQIDLVIRTGGYNRISDFVPLRIRYAEIYTTKKYWPEFEKSDFIKAIKYFNSVERKFGK